MCVAFVMVEMRTEKPMVPLALLPLAHLHRRQHRLVRDLVRDHRCRLLHDPLPAEHPRLLADEDRSCPAADGRRDDGDVADLRSVDRQDGTASLITFGMLVTGVGTLLMLLTGVEASYWRILPSFVVMGFAMWFIWAPMTTAVLNSVESAKSGVASAVNGAIREIGTAFGVALLGTLASRSYKDDFNSSADMNAVRAQADGAPRCDGEIGKNMSFAGHVIEDTGLFPRDVFTAFQDQQVVDHDPPSQLPRLHGRNGPRDHTSPASG